MAYGILRVMPVANSWVVSPGFPFPGHEFSKKEAAEDFAVTEAKKAAPVVIEVLDREGELEYVLTY
jgi:hypothetical protein